jgi:hypothetical protein
MRKHIILAAAATCVAAGALMIAFFVGVASAPSVNPPTHHYKPPHVTVQIHGRYNNILHV